VPAAVFATLAEDELVVRRAAEMDAAKLQEQARAAAQRDDWAGVDAALDKVRALGADNRWISGVVAELSSLSQVRDRALFSKEASYSAQRMQTRMTARNESDEPSPAAPLYLRRKSSQGKAGPGSEGRR
jgi:Ca-activated chloride channel family protein